jgi:GntR family transcriptional regulator/MocR family aminotransferase
MPKQAMSGRGTPITLDHSSPVPLHRQIYNWLRHAILSGQLRPGQRLPSTRILASQLGISRNTTNTAYDQLLAEGYLDSKTGYGTTVARDLPEALLQVTSGPARPKSTALSPEVALSDIGNLAMARQSNLPASLSHSTDVMRSGFFRAGVPAVELFPYKLWAQLVARRARRSLPEVSLYQEPAGYRPLREAIAAHLGVARGVRCQPEQIIMVTGSQGALDLSARLLLNPGDFAWLEDPGYFGARYALQNSGAQLAPIPVKEDGLDVAEGKRRCPQARLASVTPSHQFPIGVTMGLAQRLALLDWASQSGAWILEDDYDSEFRFGGRPLEALQGLDRNQRVIYIGTFSKVLFPALRLGYLVVPPKLVEPFIALRRFTDTHLPLLEQMALADFIMEGHFVRHIRRMRTLYASRRDALVAAIKSELGDWLEVQPPEAGMHLTGWLPPGIDDQIVAQKAAAQGIDLLPISRLSLNPLARGGLVLSYAAISEEEIWTGISKLGQMLRSLPKGG